MGAPALPPGWRDWPKEDLEQLLAGLESIAGERQSGKGPWLCDVADCDGRPHKGRRHPHSRAEQREPADDDWDYWNLFAGRGFGKTRTGAEWAIGRAKNEERGALVGPTAADVRDIMVEGESGILACARATFRPRYEPSKRRLVYPNGSMQFCYSADEPERLRGVQHHYAWADELAAWRYLQYAWDMLSMGMRLGEHPQICTTTTPRPLPLIKELAKHPRGRLVTGSTYANLHNLAPTFQRTVLERYAGTTLGRQELDAEILEDMPGALVRRATIEQNRVPEAPELDLIVVGVDPAGTGTGDEAGIVIVGRGKADKHLYVLADHSGQMTARQTGLTAWRVLYEHHAAHLVYEDNFGKQWLRDGLIDAFADHHNLSAAERRKLKDGEENADMGEVQNPFRMLRKVTAQHGKVLRAQPVAMQYEQGKVHHVGVLAELEDQLTTWNPYDKDAKLRESPDRIDALVHAATFVMARIKATGSMVSPHALGIGRATGGVHPIQRILRRTAS